MRRAGSGCGGLCRGEEIQSASIHGASSFLYTVGYQQGRINYFLAHSELVPRRGIAGMRRSIMQRSTGGPVNAVPDQAVNGLRKLTPSGDRWMTQVARTSVVTALVQAVRLAGVELTAARAEQNSSRSQYCPGWRAGWRQICTSTEGAQDR